MLTFNAYTRFFRPGLHLWLEGTPVKLWLHPAVPVAGPGWVQFEYDLTAPSDEPLRFMLFEFDELNDPGLYESDEHQRVLVRTPAGAWPEDVWFTQGTNRVLTADPRIAEQSTVRVHLISRARYRPSQLFLWDAAGGMERRIDVAEENDLGPVFEFPLEPHEKSLFNFKFIRRDGSEVFNAFEPDFANRLWSAHDGAEIWTHSETGEVSSQLPQMRTLRVHLRQGLPEPARMRLWAENGEYVVDIDSAAQAGDWSEYTTHVYTNLPYGFCFWNPDHAHDTRWEHTEALRRGVRIAQDTEIWTIEGDNTLFDRPPRCNRRVELSIVARPPTSPLGSELFAHVWVNRARSPLVTAVPVDAQGRTVFQTFADVVTSVKFYDADGHWETLDRHTLRAESGNGALRRYVVLDRPPLLHVAPPADVFQDPPFVIQRPGSYAENGHLRFVLHAPQAAWVQVIGEWTDWEADPIAMRSTRDGTYWWAEVPESDVVSGLADAGDFHGARYRFLFNGHVRRQDPAAGWVENSSSQAASRLIRSDNYEWRDQQWQRPGWEYLLVYQLHAGRFSNRHQNEPPLRRLIREIEDDNGYLRELGVTAIQLLPLNEVGTTNSWGYDPAFFYAIESSYCGDEGPDVLKELVDICHRHGLAVILDVVFNHAGHVDNILWDVARQSYFDGDTRWGAMINYDHPQCVHFFAENLVYLAREFHIDGFRLDHTATIVHSDRWDAWSGFVRELGSGGGWDFLHAIRYALRTKVGDRCILMAEHLPNEWSLTNRGGPMDSQWCDDFHDRMVDACRRTFGMTRLADAMRLGHTACDQWYNVTNYPESHDEVGNVRDRISYVAGYGQGLRMSKVAAAGTLLARGIPLFFMGAEAGEDQQFQFGSSAQLNLDHYQENRDRSRIRHWWRELCLLHRNPCIQGPSPLEVRFTDRQLLAFTRGEGSDYYVLLNFGGWSGYRSLAELNLPHATYRELWNSTWPDFAIASENEDEHTNWGRTARLNRNHWLHIPDYGAVVLERV